MTVCPTDKIRVLVVDDSLSMRMLIRSILSSDPAIEVIGVAADGVEALEKAQELKPDLITMDVEMPRMDGISAVRQLMSKMPVRVIMLSSLTHEGARTTFEALDAGAVDYIAKSSSSSFPDELKVRVKVAARARFARGVVTQPSARQADRAGSSFSDVSVLKDRKISYVGIGASTGGPVAVLEVLSQIPAGFPYGICVAVHMPKAFTGPFAERLNSKCPLIVREAVEGDQVRPGTVLVAPGGMHITFQRHSGGMMVKMFPTSDYPQHIYVPSVDLMLSSMAEVSGGLMLGVVLTGMGNDGFKGMQTLKQKGGVTLVQNEATSTIYGMPRACVEGGVADVVLPLGQIGQEIARLA